MDLISIVGVGIGLMVVGAVAGAGIICSGLTGYMATSTESISYTGEIKGNALVVYDPGVTGAAKNAAAEIANNLKSKGYNVTLAGVSSSTAANTSKYDMIIVGGPMYFGKVSNSIDKYLKTLTLPQNAKLGVFGTTGAGEFNNDDIKGISKQVASLQGNNAVIKTLRNGNAAIIDCTDFVSATLG
ncbi:flavodoxin domain-containing protein [Methanobacterium sp.]|uniref:flavodoxin domain-containing protein n=1 Tax=Methanobacterium sp. TaxID=2164 RepID=UPI003C787A97